MVRYGISHECGSRGPRRASAATERRMCFRSGLRIRAGRTKCTFAGDFVGKHRYHHHPHDFRCAAKRGAVPPEAAIICKARGFTTQ